MSKAIIDAAASYFGMDPAQLSQGTMSTNAEGLCFTFKVQCSDEDYLGIADRMRAMREPAPQANEFVVRPTLQEVMRDPVAYIDRPECDDMLNRAMSLSKAVQDKVEAAGVQLTEIQGVGGRTVLHVDAPAAEEDSGLPDAVWLSFDDLTQQQRELASDWRGNEATDKAEFLVQVAMLTPEQLAKAGKT